MFDLHGFHNSHCIYPLGYRGRRLLPSISDPKADAIYLFQVGYKGVDEGPDFVITDEQAREFRGGTPDEAWIQVGILRAELIQVGLLRAEFPISTF